MKLSTLGPRVKREYCCCKDIIFFFSVRKMSIIETSDYYRFATVEKKTILISTIVTCIFPYMISEYQNLLKTCSFWAQYKTNWSPFHALIRSSCTVYYNNVSSKKTCWCLTILQLGKLNKFDIFPEKKTFPVCTSWQAGGPRLAFPDVSKHTDKNGASLIKLIWGAK